MSFMKGFGSGFETAFQAGIERKERRRDDTFRLMYEDFLRNREANETRINEDSKAVKKAKALVESVPGLPEGAWVKVYEWVQGGLDDAQIMENLQTGTFTPSEMPAGQVKETTPAESQTRQAMAPTDTESLEAPEAPRRPSPAQPAAPARPARPEAGTPQKKGPLGGLLQKPGLFAKKETKTGSRDGDYALKRIAEITGLTEDEILKTYQRIPDEPTVDTSSAPKFTPAHKTPELPSLEQAIFARDNARTESEAELATAQVEALIKAEQIEQMLRGRADKQGEQITLRVQRPDGSGWDFVDAEPSMNGGYQRVGGGQIEGQILGRVDDTQQEWLWELAKDSTDKPAMDYKEKQSGLISMYRIGGEMASLVEAFPELQQQTVSGVIASGQRWLSEFIAAREALKNMPFFQNGGGQSVERILETVGKGGQISTDDAAGLSALEQELNVYLGQNNNDIAAAKLLFDTRAALMAYQIGAAAGQTGRELQEKEREMFLNLAKGGVTPQKFMENMGGLLAGLRRDLEQQSSSLRDYNQKVNLFEQRFKYRPFEIVPTMEEALAKAAQDPMTAKGIKTFEKYDPLTSPLFNNRPEVQKPQERQKTPLEQPKPQEEEVGVVPPGSKIIGHLKDGRPVYIGPDGTQFVQ